MLRSGLNQKYVHYYLFLSHNCTCFSSNLELSVPCRKFQELQLTYVCASSLQEWLILLLVLCAVVSLAASMACRLLFPFIHPVCSCIYIRKGFQLPLHCLQYKENGSRAWLELEAFTCPSLLCFFYMLRTPGRPAPKTIILLLAIAICCVLSCPYSIRVLPVVTKLCCHIFHAFTPDF